MRVAVVGANGQVGTEVCLFLNAIPGVEPIAVVRSELGTALLRRLGVSCRVGSVARKGETRSLLEGCSLVADFSLPGGLPSEARAGMRRNIWNALSQAPDAAYAFVSSTMAFGMTVGEHPYAEKTVSRTLYARQKRHGERVAAAAGALLGRRVFNIRLGEVHGELQAVSRHLCSTTDGRPIALPFPERPSDAVFPSTIATVLAAIGGGTVKPGRYTLVEEPAWTSREVLALYAQQAGVELRVLDTSSAAPRLAGLRSMLGGALRSIASNKELLTAHAIPPLPEVEARLKAWHQRRRAASEVAAALGADALRLPHLLGPVPGRRFNLGPSEHPVTGALARSVRATLDSKLGSASHNFRD